MPLTAVYESADEEAVHRDAIETLAKELDRPVAEVRPVYEAEFVRLKDGARVGGFLRFFAQRRARAVRDGRENETPA